ncbi:Hypothetical protein, putative [Bodo saltans]|uniref:Uncharacterized protein n=1 Tax=Bodo saltans TaxID=75058 RepID=A0A0S4J4I1_BODSA|nr:Hypothetical protein, putative [Bodo saltans]|eukprot:CUG76825.1 Hypothetical protein, putative [Bodo saltans]
MPASTPSSPLKAKDAQQQQLVPMDSISALEPLPPAKSFDWLTSFPSPDDLEAFISGSTNNASIARTCLKEAKETKILLQEAMGRGEEYVRQCDERIRQRTKNVAMYQTEVNKLRSKVVAR